MISDGSPKSLENTLKTEYSYANISGLKVNDLKPMSYGLAVKLFQIYHHHVRWKLGADSLK